MSLQEIKKVIDCWLNSFTGDTVKTICDLYDDQASLWGTFSPIKRNNKALIANYFEQIFKFKNRNVELNESNIRLFDNIAICNGLYTFNWVNQGVKEITKARFSFVYIKKDNKWLIAEHHSSILPSN